MIIEKYVSLNFSWTVGKIKYRYDRIFLHLLDFNKLFAMITDT